MKCIKCFSKTPLWVYYPYPICPETEEYPCCWKCYLEFCDIMGLNWKGKTSKSLHDFLVKETPPNK